MDSVWDTLLNAAYEWNLCRLMFVIYIVVISLSGTVINFMASVVPLPDFFLQAFKFGKMAHGRANRFISLFEIPKRLVVTDGVKCRVIHLRPGLWLVHIHYF